MFFVLSKTLYYLTLPYTVITLLFVASVIVRGRRWRRRLFGAALGLLIFFSNEFISNEIMAWWEVDAVAYREMAPRKLGIVLTGATMPHMDPDDRVYFSRGADRVIHTVQLYKHGLIAKVLISGGTGSLSDGADPEADKFRDAMVMMGVPAENIIIENKTRNTAESAIEVGKMIRALGYQANDCLLITSAFHMRRSLACYQKAGFNLDPFSTDFYAHRRVFHFDVLFIPKLDAMINWQKLAKEWTGMIAYKIVGYI